MIEQAKDAALVALLALLCALDIATISVDFWLANFGQIK